LSHFYNQLINKQTKQVTARKKLTAVLPNHSASLPIDNNNFDILNDAQMPMLQKVWQLCTQTSNHS